MSPLKLSPDAFRSPLGIIGLFISLVYGVAGLVFSSTATDLDYRLQQTIVYFIVGYPLIILGVFYLLVTRHSHNLYAPSDFKKSEDYLKYAERAMTLRSAKMKLQTTISEYGVRPDSIESNDMLMSDAAASDLSFDDGPVIPHIVSPNLSIDLSNTPQPGYPRFDILGKEFVAINFVAADFARRNPGYQVHREPSMGHDIFATGPYECVFVDVKLVTENSTIEKIITNAIESFRTEIKFVSDLFFPQSVALSLAFVVDETDIGTFNRIKEQISNFPHNHDLPIRVEIHHFQDINLENFY